MKKVEEFLQYGIIGWDIKVVRVHQVESYQNSLFNDESYGLSEIETIENKCLVALNCIKKKMVPFIEDPKSVLIIRLKICIIIQKRPLYKAKKPYIVSKEEIISYKFLERISHLSWNKEDSDFYEVISKDKKSYGLNILIMDGKFMVSSNWYEWIVHTNYSFNIGSIYS